MRAHEAFPLTRVAMAVSQVASLMLSGPEVLVVYLPAYVDSGGPCEWLRRVLAAA